MSNFENANPPPRTWDFMETVFIGLVAYAVFALTCWFVLAMLAVPDGVKALAQGRFQAYGVAYIVSSPLTIAVLWIAIRIAHRDFAEYLALNWPRPGELFRATAIMAILLWVESWALSFVGVQKIWSSSYVSVVGTVGFLIYMIGGCIAAPVMEEFVFRGFMFRGWSQSFLGPVGTIVLTSVVWGATHIQYDWFERFWIVVTGLALGYFRWRSDSTWLTVMVHSAINTFVFLSVGL